MLDKHESDPIAAFLILLVVALFYAPILAILLSLAIIYMPLISLIGDPLRIVPEVLFAMFPFLFATHSASDVRVFDSPLGEVLTALEWLMTGIAFAYFKRKATRSQLYSSALLTVAGVWIAGYAIARALSFHIAFHPRF